MKIIPKIDYQEALKEYLDNNTEKTKQDFDSLWNTFPKTIRTIYGWFLAYQDVLDWFSKSFKGNDIYVYPSFTKNASCNRKNRKVFFGVQRDLNRHLDFGLIIHELCHILYDLPQSEEQKTERLTISYVKKINKKFKLNLSHGDPSKIIDKKL